MAQKITFVFKIFLLNLNVTFGRANPGQIESVQRTKKRGWVKNKKDEREVERKVEVGCQVQKAKYETKL